MEGVPVAGTETGAGTGGPTVVDVWEFVVGVAGPTGGRGKGLRIKGLGLGRTGGDRRCVAGEGWSME